jgi:hypothetical protein
MIGRSAPDFELRAPFRNKRTRRLAAATEADAIGRGGIARFSRATGVSSRAIASGLDQLNAPNALDAGNCDSMPASRRSCP